MTETSGSSPPGHMTATLPARRSLTWERYGSTPHRLMSGFQVYPVGENSLSLEQSNHGSSRQALMTFTILGIKYCTLERPGSPRRPQTYGHQASTVGTNYENPPPSRTSRHVHAWIRNYECYSWHLHFDFRLPVQVSCLAHGISSVSSLRHPLANCRGLAGRFGFQYQAVKSNQCPCRHVLYVGNCLPDRGCNKSVSRRNDGGLYNGLPFLRDFPCLWCRRPYGQPSIFPS